MSDDTPIHHVLTPKEEKFEHRRSSLGFILGPMMEENLRRALLLSRGDPSVFFTRPLSLAFLLMAAAMLVVVALPSIRRKREDAFKEA